VLHPVIPARARIDVDDVVPNDDLVRLYVVGELVESAAAPQVEAGVVPVAGQDAIADTSAVQGKAQVRAAVVDGVDFVGTGGLEDGDAVAAAGDDRHLPKFVARADLDESFKSGGGGDRCHGNLPAVVEHGCIRSESRPRSETSDAAE